MPLPTRCCSGIRHCHPELPAMARVYGTASRTAVVWVASALSLNSQCDQSVNPTPRVLPINRPRNPVQSMNRSPSMTSPRSSLSEEMKPSPSVATSTILPSTRLQPWRSLKPRRKRA